jgi:hypothetical protein
MPVLVVVFGLLSLAEADLRPFEQRLDRLVQRMALVAGRDQMIDLAERST